jgi:hypothetical protein
MHTRNGFLSCYLKSSHFKILHCHIRHAPTAGPGFEVELYHMAEPIKTEIHHKKADAAHSDLHTAKKRRPP